MKKKDTKAVSSDPSNCTDFDNAALQNISPSMIRIINVEAKCICLQCKSQLGNLFDLSAAKAIKGKTSASEQAVFNVAPAFVAAMLIFCRG